MNNKTTVSGSGGKPVSSPKGNVAAALRLNFKNTPLQTVLRYLHEATGLPIQVESNVDIQRLINVWSDELLDRRGAFDLLKRVLEGNGYAAIYKQGMLSIIRRQDAKKHYIPLPSLPCVAVGE
jgi:type II secretory pathway component GspD/PulD (secretin)